MVSWVPPADTCMVLVLFISCGVSGGPQVVADGVRGGPQLVAFGVLGPPGVRGKDSTPGVYGGPSPLLELVEDLRRSLLHHFQSGCVR